MTIREIIQRDSAELTKISPTAHLDIELLLAHALNKDRSFINAHDDYVLSPDELKLYETYITQRFNYVPIALITGKREFYGLEFSLTKDTFNPRPETELIVEYINKHFAGKKITMLDLGTGSGAIPVAVGYHNPDFTITAVDISEKTLAIAKKNAAHHHVTINFIHSNLFEYVHGNYDIITANLPYVPVEIFKQNKFLHHEPAIAITDQGDGLRLIKKVFREASSFLERDGIILFEMHFTQEQEIIRYGSEQGLTYQETLYDIQGFPRIVIFKYC